MLYWLIVPTFFSSIRWTQKIWSVIDLLCWNWCCWSWIILPVCGEGEGCWIKFFVKFVTVICLNNYYSQFYHPSCKLITLMDSYCASNSTLFQIELMSLQISEYNVYLLHESFLLEFDHCNFNLRRTRLRSWWHSYKYFYLPNITNPVLGDVILTSIECAVGSPFSALTKLVVGW
jgi:hypothetical protein